MNTPHDLAVAEPAPDITDDAIADAEADDPVLAALGRAEGHYLAARAAWKRESDAAEQALTQLAATQEAERAAREQVKEARAELDAERKRAAHHKERAKRMAHALKDVHRALFGGNVFELILKSCLAVTGATRGVYLSAWGDGRFAARAAVDVDGYPRKPPSDFVRGLCRRALDREESVVANGPADLAGLPAPDGPGETFQNCLAAPAVLLKQFNGVVVLADKPGRGFDPDDAELVMGIGDHAGVAIENRRLQDELMRAYFAVVGVLADAIEVKDPYTSGHCELVARLARMTAARLAADDDTLRSVSCYGGLLHDVGKIGVSDGVLNKPGKLLPEEWVLMQSHVRIGRDLLAHVPALDGVAGVVLHHHERWDGAGYPDKLAKDRIPLAARIVCVVDAYCAMISKRSYKESSTPAEARAELARCKGTQFDPAVVDAFLAVLDDPEAADDCPDGCGVFPALHGSADFHHAVRPPAPPKG